ncbi:unnamed protein product [Mycena citricolor]|uniref:Ubiquitin-like protease family profile domain-containing protein n=1 Tax=Mycena citricolor TaxID=2018698 RepID=A0AAD2HXE3_9AGAR|nr:unnamed protein product [Mycena citricolor]
MAADPHLLIPPGIRSQLLPADKISVWSLVDFDIPPVSRSCQLPVEAFMCHEEAAVTSVEIIRSILPPPDNVVSAICQHIIKGILNGVDIAPTIQCVHLGPDREVVPLWITSYWMDLTDVRKSHSRWSRAKLVITTALRKSTVTLRPDSRAPLSRQIFDLLSLVSWTENTRGFENSGPILELSWYIGRSWFTDAQEGHMLELLRADLLGTGSVFEDEICDVWMINKIRDGFQNSDAYGSTRALSGSAHQLGQVLSSGERHRVGMIINLSNTHWVACVVDACKDVILYGDSLQNGKSHGPRPEEKSVLSWWTKFHTGRDFEWGRLDTARQEDGYNCGLFAINALSHFFFPHKYDLLSSNTSSGDIARLEMLKKILNKHMNILPDSISLTVRNTLEDLPSMFDANDKQITTEWYGSNSESTSSNSSIFPLIPNDSELLPEPIADQDWRFDSPAPPSPSTMSVDSFPSAADDSMPEVEWEDMPLNVAFDDHKSPVQQSKLVRKPALKRLLSSPPSSPEQKRAKAVKIPKFSTEKVRVVSNIREGLESEEKTGIVRFYAKKATQEDQDRALQQWKEGRIETFTQGQGFSGHPDRVLAEKAERERAGARLRQQKHRDSLKLHEIRSGVRSPGGTKVKVSSTSVAFCQSHGSTSLCQQLVISPDDLAEATRPGRAAAKRSTNSSRNPKKGSQRAKPKPKSQYKNWLNPLFWPKIEAASQHPSVGPNWSASAIVAVLKQDVLFSSLSRTTVNGWIDRSGPKPCWSEKTLVRVGHGFFQGHPNGGQRGVLSHHPEVVDTVVTQLRLLRESGAQITVVTVHAIMIAAILLGAPEIFQKEFKDGSHFVASESFIRRWLHSTMNWSVRQSTNAAQKLPRDWQSLCEKFALRLAWMIKEHDIPAALIVNSDQTQVIYASGAGFTWADTGAKQVSVVGQEEKRAFTALLGITADGNAVGMQVIYDGLTKRSLPPQTARGFTNLVEAGSRFVFSGTSTYWSNIDTMKSYVNEILAPYFDRRKVELKLPPSQKSIWAIDVWPVQASSEFRGWLVENHPSIAFHYIPGGTTGVCQPLDVGINRVFKHAIKRSVQEDTVREVREKMRYTREGAIEFDRTKPVLRGRSVGWLWDAFQIISDAELVKKAFALCQAGAFNLSYESLTSFEIRERLRNLKANDPDFWEELESGRLRALERHNAEFEATHPSNPESYLSTDPDQDEDFEDDADISTAAIKENVMQSCGVPGEQARLTSDGWEAEDIENNTVDNPPEDGDQGDGQQRGRSKRKIKVPRKYLDFWHH